MDTMNRGGNRLPGENIWHARCITDRRKPLCVMKPLKNDRFCAKSSRKSRAMSLTCLRACPSRPDGGQATPAGAGLGEKRPLFKGLVTIGRPEGL
ncbi:MAG: hypothetical protein DRH37_10820 [Deltaproteobacteria bacterium]|nr:MAG: hypothetical protein DRH37_10820 [Deltaproteobacteria bacterium]